MRMTARAIADDGESAVKKRDTSAVSADAASFNDVIKSAVQSKLLLSVHDVKN